MTQLFRPLSIIDVLADRVTDIHRIEDKLYRLRKKIVILQFYKITEAKQQAYASYKICLHLHTLMPAVCLLETEKQCSSLQAHYTKSEVVWSQTYRFWRSNFPYMGIDNIDY